MKLSEIIKKYEPLGWKFEEDTWLDPYWTFKSPRLKERRGFSIDIELEDEVEESEMLKMEREAFVFQEYGDKVADALEFVANDIYRQLGILDEKKINIPEEIDISFKLKLK